jgi:hypothetical protein
VERSAFLQDGLAGGIGLRPPGGDAVLVGHQSPRQVGVSTVELVVEPVAEPADRLRHRQTRGDGVQHERERHAQAAAGEPGADRPAGHGAPDAEPALPDVERPDRAGVVRATEVVVGRCDHVVDARPHDPERHRPDRDVEHHPRRRPPAAEPDLGDDTGRDDPGQNAQGVRPDGQRTEVPHTLGRTRDGSEKPHGFVHAAQPTGPVAGRSPSQAPAARTDHRDGLPPAPRSGPGRAGGRVGTGRARAVGGIPAARRGEAVARFTGQPGPR